ncbi:MAG: NADPH:quinone reductase [Planctomycetaceae bacterium]|nr:NADPH:quinone reductase [Planctomycetaceae bacterium]
MKAAFIEQTGAPDVIQYGDLSDPTPGASEVLVKVGAVAVNPIDTYLRAGIVAMPFEFPYIIGSDVAGTVEAVGSNVTRFQPGDRVWGSNQGFFGRPGTFAEYAAIDEQWLYPTPDEQCDEQAAAGALTGITAHLGLFLHAGLREGEIVFVNGGTGGVGSAVVQFAKAAGARVIATVGSDEKRKLCETLGADLVLDYHSSTLDDEIRAFAESNGGLDIWWETQREPSFDRTVGLMKKRGRIVLMAGRDARPAFPVGPFYVNELRLVGFAMFNASPDEQSECADEMNHWAASGQWKPLIGEALPLADAAKAHQLQEANTLQKQGSLTGKIVLKP